MANILKGFFAQNKPEDEKNTIPDTTTLPTQTVQHPKSAPLRGPGGKFVSKKVTEKTPPAVKKDAGVTQTVTFYGNAIRKWHVDDVWYFSLLDILTMAKVLNPLAYLSELKTNEKTKELISKNTKTIAAEACVSYPQFMQLLPILRSKDCVFPGPFPEWLADTALLPKN